MSTLTQSVSRILKDVNRIQDPPPFAIFNTAFELLTFASEDALASERTALWANPFTDVFSLGCSSAVAARSKWEFGVEFERILGQWFEEEAANSEDYDATTKYYVVNHSVNREVVSVIVSCLWSKRFMHRKQQTSSLDDAGTVVETALKTLQSGSAPGESVKKGSMLVTSALTVLGHLVPKLEEISEKFEISKVIVDAAIGALTSQPALVAAIARQLLIPLLGHYPAESAASTVLVLVEQTAAAGRHSDTVILAASLFDTLVSTPNAGQCGIRANPQIWEAIVSVLDETIVGGGSLSLAERATAQMQAVHLLQRIVSLCEDEWGQNVESRRARNKQNIKVEGTPSGKKEKSNQKKGSKSNKNAQPEESSAQIDTNGSKVSQTRSGPHTFNSYFTWGDGHSHPWGDYFLHFEALNEFSLHICSQVISKIPSLIAHSPAEIHPIFIDMLVRKGLCHPNNGVRKAVLGTLWKDFTSRDLGLLRDETIFQIAFVTAADWRLCSEVDKLVVPTSFMETVERPEEEVPLSVIDPIAEQMCLFYKKVLSIESTTHLATNANNNDKLLMIIKNLTERSSRFTVAMGVRVIAFICRHVTTLVATEAICEAFLTAHQLAMLGRHPMWLEGRLGGILTEALLCLMLRIEANGPSPNDAITRAWRVLSALAYSNEDTLDAPASLATSFVGAHYITQQMASKLENCAAWSMGLRIESLEADIAATSAMAAEIPESELRDLGLRVGAADKLDPRLIAPVINTLLSTISALGDRTCVSDIIILNTTAVFRSIASAVSVGGLTGAGSESLLASTLEGILGASRRLISTLDSDNTKKKTPLSVTDGLADAAAIVLTWMMQNRDETQTACPELVSYTAEALSVLTSSIQSGSGRQTRAALRLLRSALLAVSNSTFKGQHSPSANAFSFTLAANVMFGDSTVKATELFNLLTANPLPLCTNEGPTSAVHNSESERYMLDLLFLAVGMLSDGPKLVARWCEDYLDGCVILNLPTLYALIAACVAGLKEGSEGADAEERSDLQCRLIRLMIARAADGGRLQAFRCSAIAYGSLSYCRDDAFVAEVASTVLVSDESTDRVIFFVALGVTTKVLSQPALLWEQYREVLLEIAMFINSAAVGDEELECSFAALEPAFALLPESVRARLPPTTRLLTLARSLAIVAIAESVTATNSVCAFVSDLLMMNVNDRRITHTPCMPNSKTHRSRLRLWQLVHTFLPILNLTDWDVLIPLLQEHCLPINNISSVRRPMELMAMRGYQLRPDLLHLLLPFLDDYDIRAQVAGTYAQVAINTILAHQFNKTNNVFEEIYPRLLRIANSYQHLLRIIAHIGIHAVLTARKEQTPEHLTADQSRMLHYLNNAAEVQKFLVKYYHVVIVDVMKETTPYRNYCVQRMEANHWLHEGISAATFGRLAFLASEVPCAMSYALPLQAHQSQSLLQGLPSVREAYRRQVAMNCIPSLPMGTGPCDEFLDYTDAVLKLQQNTASPVADGVDASVAGAPPQEGGSEDSNIQRKVQSWWTSEIYNQLHPRALGSATRQQLIIVGSLLDNPVNIAGLCRCGDIFAIERVIVPNKKVFEHPHFIAAARSAELWVPWEEVAPRDLTKYLQEMKLEGYTIVGVEQTADSQSMADFKFPTRAVVVLGSEGKGVPAEVLPYLDVCVEIPQFGLIRSLNVHVTGAIAMYEYSVQHVMNATTRKY